jgi:formamidopyrimidine-DNA glycosylase
VLATQSISSQRLRFMQMACGLGPERMNPDFTMGPENGSKSNPSTPLKGPVLGQRIVSGTGGFTIGGPSSG